MVSALTVCSRFRYLRASYERSGRSLFCLPAKVNKFFSLQKTLGGLSESIQKKPTSSVRGASASDTNQVYEHHIGFISSAPPFRNERRAKTFQVSFYGLSSYESGFTNERAGLSMHFISRARRRSLPHSNLVDLYAVIADLFGDSVENKTCEVFARRVHFVIEGL